MRCIGDLEANGLLRHKDHSPPADTIWCGVFKDIDTKAVTIFRIHEMIEMEEFLDEVDFLVMHNGADYDIPLMESILEYKYQGELFDSFIVSQLTCPDRVGGHGLENFGKIFGRPKPPHEDWSKFSPEMLYRCQEDVEINYLTYLLLLEELGDGFK